MRTVIATGVAVLLLASAVRAELVPANPEGHRIMIEVGSIPAPDGWKAFCISWPGECRSVPRTRPVVLTERLWKELELVNRRVNSEIRYVDDPVGDVWSLPVDEGDCEDFVLLKRKRLVERGWPPGALLVTVVVAPDGRGHSLLTVRTDRGEFVLDNNTSRILEWVDTPYTFMSRQSSSNPNQWAALDR
ncbi:transglutaminase-like cysteine peptidase [Ancylobacter terrae]|uniref:transglutaminase-like cysteine peptidase n=1 Tax=Ancylobacter sp. sgz301288 TaxID=3342077 RepID=UPI0038592292